MGAAINFGMSELQLRGNEFGRELAAALVLAGDRAERDHQVMREMTAVAAREMRNAVEWLRGSGLPEQIVADYDRACRKGFQAELHRGMVRWEKPSHQARHAA